MPTLLTRDLPQNETLRSAGGGLLPATLGESLGATVDDPLLRPTELLANATDIAEEQGFFESEPALRGENVETQDDLDRLLEAGSINPIQHRRLGRTLERLSPLVSSEELNAEYGELGLAFDRPTRRRVAELLAEEKREEIIRQDVISRAPQGALAQTARFGAAFVGAAIDPLNIASAFVPVVSQARFAGMAARVGVNAARVGRGGVEGLAGAALVEPLIYGLSAEQQLDYEMSDALVNVALGGVLGGGAHAIGGRIGDFLSGVPAEVREQAFRASVAQVVDGRAVDVGPVFRTHQQFADRLRDTTAVGRFLDPSPVDLQRAVDVSAPVTPATPPAVFVPSVSRKGVVREFPDRATAEQAARKMRGETEVREAADGRYVIGRLDRELDVYRSNGEVKRFKTERLANKFIRDTKRVGATAVPVGRAGNRAFVVVSGATDRTVDAIKAAPELVAFEPGRAAEPAFMPLDLQPRGESLLDMARREAAPGRDALADFDASFRTKMEADRPSEAEVEVEHARTTVENLRENGLLAAGDEAELAEIDQILARPDVLKRAANAAAYCLARTP